MFWWAKFIFFAAVALFFLEFGIEEMIRAYQVNNPHLFLASFFSASFIILISGTLLVAFVWRMVRRARGKDSKEQGGE
jgi:TRAP-type C4-dicarboxylate transport system permease small subunit